MGSRGPQRDEKRYVAFKTGAPKPPEWLGADGAAEYVRAVKEMEAAGVPPQQVDAAVLCTYAHAAAEIGKLAVLIATEGSTLPGPRGTPVKNPLVDVLAQHNRTLLAAAAALGFSPASRARIPRSAATGKSNNPFKAFLKGNAGQ